MRLDKLTRYVFVFFTKSAPTDFFYSCGGVSYMRIVTKDIKADYKRFMRTYSAKR